MKCPNECYLVMRSGQKDVEHCVHENNGPYESHWVVCPVCKGKGTVTKTKKKTLTNSVTPRMISEAAAAMGRKGGKARAKKMTAEQRSESCRKAVKARWAKKRKVKS